MGNPHGHLHSIFLLGILALSHGMWETRAQERIRCSSEDRERVDSILQHVDPTAAALPQAGKMAGGSPEPGALLLAFGLEFLGTPYVAHTLEGPEEQLVVRLDGMDCATFVEVALALFRTWRGGADEFEEFARELERIRYRDGKMEGYTSRLHYFSEWIRHQHSRGAGKDLTKALGGIPREKPIDFMSTHPQAYERLKDDPALVEEIRAIELGLGRKEWFYIPTGRIREAEKGFRNGDVVGITTNVEGLDIMHVGILVYREDSWHLLHASSREGRVVVSGDPLGTYLEHTPKASGIMLMRPL
jgi:hypothetical protein